MTHVSARSLLPQGCLAAWWPAAGWRPKSHSLRAVLPCWRVQAAACSATCLPDSTVSAASCQSRWSSLWQGAWRCCLCCRVRGQWRSAAAGTAVGSDEEVSELDDGTQSAPEVGVLAVAAARLSCMRLHLFLCTRLAEGSAPMGGGTWGGHMPCWPTPAAWSRHTAAAEQAQLTAVSTWMGWSCCGHMSAVPSVLDGWELAQDEASGSQQPSCDEQDGRADSHAGASDAEDASGSPVQAQGGPAPGRSAEQVQPHPAMMILLTLLMPCKRCPGETPHAAAAHMRHTPLAVHMRACMISRVQQLCNHAAAVPGRIRQAAQTQKQPRSWRRWRGGRPSGSEMPASPENRRVAGAYLVQPAQGASSPT